MRILVLTSTTHSIPVLSVLLQKGLLSGLAVPEREEEEVHMLKAWSAAHRLPVFSCKRENVSLLLQDVLSASVYDIVIVFGFPWKIPRSVLTIPPHGFFNVHFSLLPAYRGPVPVFWQMRMGESFTGVTVHRMDDSFDTGEIACSVRLPMIPGETLGLCSSRLSQASVGLITELINKISNGGLQLMKQDVSQASCYARPGIDAMLIDWICHDSEEIQRIVNACNPLFQGALTEVNGMPVRILEVTPVDAPDYPGQEPGTVVHSDNNYGVFVICRDRKTIRIAVVRIPEGIISGGKLAVLGIHAGARFGKKVQ